MNTRRLAIRLWMLTIMLFGALYVLGVLITGHGSPAVAIGIMAIWSLILLVLIVAGFGGLVSYNAHQKEARRGESDDRRP